MGQVAASFQPTQSVRPVSGRLLGGEILIVDGGSTDGTLEIVAGMPDCRLIQHAFVNYADFKDLPRSLLTPADDSANYPGRIVIEWRGPDGAVRMATDGRSAPLLNTDSIY